MPEELIGQGEVIKGKYSALERRTQILRFLSDGKIRSTSEIAAALQMRNSTNLRKMLLALWAEKQLLAYTESRMYRWQKPKLEQLDLFEEGSY